MITDKVYYKVSEIERVLNFRIKNSKQLVSILEELTELKVDLDVDSTPSSIEIRIKGPENKVRESVKKIQKLVKKSKNS